MASTWKEMGFGPYPVTEVENIYFNLKDGNKLAMKVWLPCKPEEIHINFKSLFDSNGKDKELFIKTIYPGNDEGSDTVFPSILEYLPYCKDSFLTLSRDRARHPWFASHGYIDFRVDIRGTGESTGYYYDEYDDQEMNDCVEFIEWVSQQPWSNKKVGMYGKSWGGFNGLQVAYKQPEALKTAISLYSTDDRFTDDIHYEGGNLIGSGITSWAGFMISNDIKPPNPRYFKNLIEWKDFWLDRLNSSAESKAATWLSHQDKDDSYWKHGSIATNYSNVKCPVLIIGGLADAYTNAAFRMAANLNDSSRAIIGPWTHQWPDVSVAGPNIDYLHLCLDWWNVHLKSQKIENDLPRLTLFVRDSIKPDEVLSNCPGKWIAISDWNEIYGNYKETSDSTINNIESEYLKHLYFGAQQKLYLCSVEKTSQAIDKVDLKPNALQGAYSGQWFSVDNGLPEDQNLPNKNSHTWLSEPLQGKVVLAGFLQANLSIEASCKGKYCLQVRLCDQFPTGESTLITKGCINLSSPSDGWCSEFPAETRKMIKINLNAAAYCIKPGHSLLVSISPTYFPLVFPSLNSNGLIFYPAESYMVYQTLTDHELSQNVTFQEPLPLLKLPVKVIEKPSYYYKTNKIDGKYVTEVNETNGTEFYPNTLYQQWGKQYEKYTTDETVSFGEVYIETESKVVFGTENESNVSTYTKSKQTLTADKQAFKLVESIEVEIGEKKVFSKSCETKIPRKYV